MIPIDTADFRWVWLSGRVFFVCGFPLGFSSFHFLPCSPRQAIDSKQKGGLHEGTLAFVQPFFCLLSFNCYFGGLVYHFSVFGDCLGDRETEGGGGFLVDEGAQFFRRLDGHGSGLGLAF